MMRTKTTREKSNATALAGKLEDLGRAWAAWVLGLEGQPFTGYDGLLKMGQQWTDDSLTIDVKTDGHGKELLVEATNVRADYYVLVHYDEDMASVQVVGYAWAEELKQSPVKTISGIKHYAMVAADLSPIAGLRSMQTVMPE
jgi:hypothetical protein